MYRQAKNVRCQPILRLNKFTSVQDALSDATTDLPEPEETLLVLSKRGKIFELNPVAALVWEGLKEAASIESLANTVTSIFKVAPHDAQRDIQNVLSEFSRLQLVEEAGL